MPPTKSTTLGRGYTIAVIATVIWSTTGIFIDYMTRTYDIPPLVLGVWRDGIVAVLLILAMDLTRPALLRMTRSGIGFFILYGMELALFNAIWIFSVKLNGAAVAVVLAYSSPAFTALLSHWLLKESLTWRKGLAVVLCLAGCVLVSGAADPAAWKGNLGGIVIGLVTGVFFAVYTLLGRTASKRGYNPWTTMVYSFTIGSICLFIFNAIGLSLPSIGQELGSGALFWLEKDITAWGILFLSAIPTLGGYGLIMVSLTYLSSSVMNLILSLEPAFTVILAYLLLGEKMSIIQILGSLLIMAGVVFLRIYGGEAD